MQKKEYLSPELQFIRLTLRDALMNSPEQLATQVDGPGDWGDLEPDPDPGIEW